MKADFFSAIAKAADSSASWSKHVRPWLDRMFARWIPPRPEESLGWTADADWARLEQEPLRARALLRWGMLVVFVLIIWAAIAKIDEVTRGEGRVIPSSQLQVIQSVDGGVVEEIKVHEGQTVNAGEVLLRIDPTRFVSSLREGQATYYALLAKKARLEALSTGGYFNPPQEVIKTNPEIVEHERTLYNSSRAELDAQLAIARQQLAQRDQELNGAS